MPITRLIRLLTVAVVALLLAPPIALPNAAGASTCSTVPCYSYGQDNTPITGNTGVSVNRWDRDIAGGGTCTADLHGSYILQDEWVPIIAGRDWLEFGTVHKQTTCKWWFWGYGVDYMFVLLGTGPSITYANHTFNIIRGPTGNTWQWWVDVTKVAEYGLYFQNVGQNVQAGLESWNLSPTVSAHGYYSLQLNIGGPWYSWSAANELPPQFQAPLCGAWVTATVYQAGQHTTCPG